MKTIVDRKTLEKELAILGKVAGWKTSLAVTEMAMISFISDHSLMMQATNLEIGYTALIGGKTTRKYRTPSIIPKILVSVQNLKRVLNAIPKKIKEISLEITGDGQGLIVNNTITVVCGMDANDFPVMPKLPFGKSYDMINYSQLACFSSFNSQADEGRAYRNHLYFDTDNGNVVATDGSRMHLVKLQSENNLKPFMLHYSARILLICPQLCNKIGNISVTKKDVFIQTGNGYISVIRPEDEYFPGYDEVMSTFDNQNPNAVISAAKKQTFIDEILEAAAITSINYKAVTFHLNKRIILSASNPDVGEFKKDVTSLSYIGRQNDETEIALNPAYLISACKDMPDDSLYTAMFLDSKHPVIFENEVGDFKALVMPLRMA